MRRLAGQSHYTATEFSAAALVVRSGAGPEGPDPRVPVAPQRVSRILDLDPRVVHFAHDRASWVPDASVS